MNTDFKLTHTLTQILIFLTCLIPISLVLSIFVTELILIIIIINFLTLNFYDKNSRKIYETSFVIFFLIFWIILILSSLFSESIGTSIRTSIFYFRFGFLVLIVNYLLVYEEKFIKYFFIHWE